MKRIIALAALCLAMPAQADSADDLGKSLDDLAVICEAKALTMTEFLQTLDMPNKDKMTIVTHCYLYMKGKLRGQEDIARGLGY